MIDSFLSNGNAWLHYPLIDLGDSSITVLMILKLILWLALVLVLNATVRWLIVDRLLAKTRFDPSLRFAISRIFGYLFILLGFYIALLVNGVNLSSLAVIAGALGVGLGFGLKTLWAISSAA